MSFSTPATPHPPGAAFPGLALAEVAAAPAASPSPPAQLLHLDCGAVPYQRTLGVCHQVSQLLLLRQAGVNVCLYRVHPVLRRCLQKLAVEHFFSWGA